MRIVMLLSLSVLAACGGGTATRRGSSPTCGIAALAGPTALLEEFRTPQQTLSEPPSRLPERTVARVAAGPALAAILGRSDSGLVVGVEGTLPPNSQPAFGVLVTQKGGATKGVMLYEGDPVEGAPRLGIVSIGGRTLPLLGIEVDMARIEDPNCPLFPDSLAQ
ncbi:MAG TPA: hypothetical protein VFY20_04635 [Gemmatimonadales bacterium]|nr:hypothetical protein [Gemmatimonadales bacterium]